ncbi:MAG: ribosomal protein S18-alanine N-acetyltransferase [Vicinamibacterales bacterium]
MNPGTPLTIERLTEPSVEDRAAILALESASFSNPWTPETFDTMLATHVSRIYVARDHGRIVAFCACWLFDDELHINTIAVDETRRRQGIARTLLRDVLDRTGARRATLEVRRSNVAALRLYDALGFTVTAVRPRYYEKPEEDGLILWLNP